jgi:putative aldouronate transport system substrate-binding protein
MLSASVLAGCAEKHHPISFLADDIPTISVVTIKVATDKFDGELVARALDEYVAPLIGARVSIEYIELENYNQVFNRYMATGNMPDAFLMWLSPLANQLRENGKLLPLDALLEEHGTAILLAVDDKTLIKAHVHDGKTYAVPNQMPRSYRLGFEYRKNIADAYGLNMSSIKNLNDLTAVLTQLKQVSDGIVPISSYSFRTWDPLFDSLGVLMNNGQTTQVVNLYDTEEYRDMCQYIRRWRTAGLLLDEDYGLTTINNYVRSPEFFGKFSNISPALPHMDSADAGEPIECVTLSKPYRFSDSNIRGAWGISAQSAHPVESMKFLNLMYSDPNVANLLIYGIEGMHYEVIDADKGIIDFPEGLTVESSGYAQFRGYFYGNQYIGYLWNGYPEDLWEQEQAFNRDSTRSFAYGFTYNPAPVVGQIAACRLVVSEYTSLLEKGIGDVDSLLNKFRAELKDAGIELVVAEKQRQLDAWLASGGT